MSKYYQATVYHQSKYFTRHPPHLSPPMSAAPGCTVERMCRLKGPLEPQWHCIPYHRGVWWNCRAKGLCNPSWRCKQFEISRRPKRSKDKRHHYACGGISLMVIICDVRFLSCSIRALCNFIWELEPFFSSHYLPGFGDEEVCVWTVHFSIRSLFYNVTTCHWFSPD